MSAYAEQEQLNLIATPLVFEFPQGTAAVEFPLEPREFNKKRAYNAFNAFVKAKSAEQGMDARAVATQSMRRGKTSDLKFQRVDDRIIKLHGRWKSDRAYQCYIDQIVSQRLFLQKQ